VQLGLRVPVSCDVAARARAVLCRDGGPEGDVGGLLGRVVGCRGGNPEEPISAECIETLCRLDDEVSRCWLLMSCGATLLDGWLLLRWSVPCLLLP
jgi:hypothetical protein